MFTPGIGPATVGLVGLALFEVSQPSATAAAATAAKPLVRLWCNTLNLPLHLYRRRRRRLYRVARSCAVRDSRFASRGCPVVIGAIVANRSEERRVGKECSA